MREASWDAAADALLAAMGSVQGVEASAPLRRSVHEALASEGTAPVSSLDRLVDAARVAGASVRHERGTLADALERVERGSPIVFGREGVWFAVLGLYDDEPVFRSFGAEPETAARRLPIDEFYQRVGLRPEAAIEFLVGEPDLVATAPSSGLTPLRRLRLLLRPDRADVLAVVAFAVATGVLLLATPIAVQALVNFVALGGAIPPLVVVAGLLFLGLAFAGVLNAVQTWVVEMLQRRLFTRVVADLGARLPRLAPEVYEARYPPELVNRFFDVITIQKTAASLLLGGLSILLSVVVGLVVLAFYHPLLLAFDLVLLVVIAGIVFGPLRRGAESACEESKAKYRVAAWLEELARNPRLFRVGGAQSWVYRRCDEAAIAYLEKRAKHFSVLFGQICVALGLHAVASTALLAIGGYLVIQGTLTLGQLVAAELIVTLVVSSVAKLGKHLESYYDLIAATEKVGQLLDLAVETPGGSAPLARDGGGLALELRDVLLHSFDEKLPSEAISLSLAAGETLCVAETSGSSPRRLVEILWGLRRPVHGTVTFDGLDLRELSRETLRSAVALAVDIEIVTGTVRENVAVGRASVGGDRVRELLRSMGVLDVLQQRHQGIETSLNAFGRPLGPHLLNTIQIARALAGRPRLVIISERVLPPSGAGRTKVLDVLFAQDRSWSLLVLSNSEDLMRRCSGNMTLPGETQPMTASA